MEKHCMEKQEIFVSYAWGGESEKIINELDSTFKKKGIEIISDKRDLGFKGMITEFMQRIGQGQAVVTVISDKYLKSPYCMFELLEIYRNLNFKERIFPIVLDDAKIFEPVPRLQYLKYWEDKKKELDDAIREFGTDAITVIGDDYKIHKKIFDNFGEVVNILKDINSLTPEMHRADNFNTLITAIGKKTRMNTSIKDIHDSRKKTLLQQLDRLYKLLDQYENKLMLDNDPKEKMKCENEIEGLNDRIQKLETDIKNS